jgi:hypothetical protein
MASSRAERRAVAMESISSNTSAGLSLTLSFDPSVAANFVNTVAADPLYTVGQVYRYGKKRFMYTQFKDAVAYAVGHIAFWDAAADDTVTNDVSEAASATKPQVRGVVLGIQTENYFGFIQTHGSGTVLHNNDNDAAIGDPIIATAADGGVCNVGTWSGPLGVGIGEVAVVAASDLQQVFIHVLGG